MREINPLHSGRLARARLADKGMLENFTEEGALLASLHHRNIIGLVGGCWSVENASVCLVMELMEGGDLLDKLH